MTEKGGREAARGTYYRKPRMIVGNHPRPVERLSCGVSAPGKGGDPAER
jgi:hypothetical protein